MEHKFFDQTEDIMGAGDLEDIGGIKEGLKTVADGVEGAIDKVGTEMKALGGDDEDVEQLDKDEPKGDDDQQAAAPPTPDVVMKDAIDGKEEVAVIPSARAPQHTEQLGTDASHSEIMHTEQSEKRQV